jgi:hypothetical protein
MRKMILIMSVLGCISLTACSGDNESTARTQAKQFIKNNIVNPDSVRWGSDDNMKAVNLGNGEWEVSGVLKWENGYGVYQDRRYDLKEKAGDANGKGWTLENIWTQ